jgi:predicted enzyme related to lactoylglutathione lyase
MTDVQKHAPGDFCWVEVGTTDAAKSKKFYGQLFGWELEDVPAGPDMSYTMLKKRGKQIGGLYELSPEQKAQGVPPHWLSYVAVDNADNVTQKAATLGGKVVMDAFDVMEVGRMAILSDPTGAHFAVWQPKTHQGAQVVNEPGTVCWTELATRDPRAAAKFYHGLFDWNGQEQDMGSMTYTMLMNGEKPAGGMFEMTEQWAGIPPYWMPYFAVEDCDATASQAEKLGGKVTVPPSDIPNIGRFAVLQDPTGATFSIIKLTMQPQN